MAKEKKTADELKALFMQETRKQPVLKDIEGVTITPMKQMAPHHPNWNALFRPKNKPTAPPQAFWILSDLQAEYDLVE